MKKHGQSFWLEWCLNGSYDPIGVVMPLLLLLPTSSIRRDLRCHSDLPLLRLIIELYNRALRTPDMDLTSYRLGMPSDYWFRPCYPLEVPQALMWSTSRKPASDEEIATARTQSFQLTAWRLFQSMTPRHEQISQALVSLLFTFHELCLYDKGAT